MCVGNGKNSISSQRPKLAPKAQNWFQSPKLGCGAQISSQRPKLALKARLWGPFWALVLSQFLAILGFGSYFRLWEPTLGFGSYFWALEANFVPRCHFPRKTSPAISKNPQKARPSSRPQFERIFAKVGPSDGVGYLGGSISADHDSRPSRKKTSTHEVLTQR